MIKELLEGKTAKERANIKGQEIAKQVRSVARTNTKFSGADYDIEITEIKAIDKGVEIFARAWDSNGQIGFGKDGTVDIERFVFINPPILVDDPNGDILRVSDSHGEHFERKLREDPIEAILQSLVHTISVKKQKFGSDKIIAGKVGRTTLTAYPNAGTGTAPVDGYTTRSVPEELYGTIHDGAGNYGIDTNATDAVTYLDGGTTTDKFTDLVRGGFGFDTDIINTDTVDSATFSLWSISRAVALGSTDVDIVNFTPLSESAFSGTGGDYISSKWGTTRFATGKDISSGITDGQYNDWAFNATGIADINKTGNTYFGTRDKWDVDNSFTGTWGTGITRLTVSMADTAGTTQDPKLVVEYSSGGGGGFLLLGIGA